LRLSTWSLSSLCNVAQFQLKSATNHQAFPAIPAIPFREYKRVRAVYLICFGTPQFLSYGCTLHHIYPLLPGCEREKSLGDPPNWIDLSDRWLGRLGCAFLGDKETSPFFVVKCECESDELCWWLWMRRITDMLGVFGGVCC